MHDLSDVSEVYVDAILKSNITSFAVLHRAITKVKECGDLEMDALECLEAYGSRRGHKLCSNFVADYRECVRNFMQIQRVEEMRRERVKQVMRGERSVKNFFDPIKAPRDSFQRGPFYN